MHKIGLCPLSRSKEAANAMAALQALKDLTVRLSAASTAEGIGDALFDVAKTFNFVTMLLVDMTKLLDCVGPAIVFSSTGRSPINDFFAPERPFNAHPFVVRAQVSDRPFVMSELRDETSAADEEWWSALPPHLRETDGIVVPVHDKGKHAWYAGFAGPQPDLSQTAFSVMSASVHAGYARFKELLDTRSARSPLSPRESECLHWVSSGKTDFEVGRILSISPRTVRFHINNAKTKLGVTTRIQAVAKKASGDF